MSDGTVNGDPTEQDPTETDVRRGPSRRAVLGAAAWSAPVIVVAGAVPAFAASGDLLVGIAPVGGTTVPVDPASDSQVFTVMLTNNGSAVASRQLQFTVFPASPANAPTDWLSFRTSATPSTAANGMASTTLAYGAPKPTNAATFTVQVTDPSDPALVVEWTISYTPAIPNLVVVRVGDSTTLDNSATPVTLDEYAPATATQSAPIRSKALPSTGTSPRPLRLSGSATSEGGLSRSSNGRYLALAGYGVGTAVTGVASSTSAAAPRVGARIEGTSTASAIDTTTTFGTGFSGNNVRGAVVSDDNAGFYAVGGVGGVLYAGLGATSSTQVAASPDNARITNIQGGTLFASAGAGNPRGVWKIDTTASAATAGTIFVQTGTTASSSYGFVQFDRSTSIAGLDTIYIADDAAGLKKFRWNGTAWSAAGTYLPSGVTGYRGLAGAVNSDGTVHLFATTAGGSANSLVRIVDTSDYVTDLSTATATTTTLATTTGTRAFRGVAFATV